jgi:hypothetical protein
MLGTPKALSTLILVKILRMVSNGQSAGKQYRPAPCLALSHFHQLDHYHLCFNLITVKKAKGKDGND